MEFKAKELTNVYFKVTGTKVDDKGKVISTLKCECGNTRNVDLKKGYTNLVSHIKSQHKDWQEVMNAFHSDKVSTSKVTTPGFSFVNSKSSKIFSWLEWIIMDNLPFNFVEKQLTQKYTNLEKWSTDSFMKYLCMLTTSVEKIVANTLPEKFGIVIDGWSDGNVHYIAIFAVFDANGKGEHILLAIAPPYDETNYDASFHKSFIEDVLLLYGKDLSNLLFLVGDNAPVNTRLSNLLDVSFVGCASHRFNLACQKFLQPYETMLLGIHSLMVTLSTIKQAGKLRLKTKLEPVKRNATRWSSTYDMLKRFFQLLEFIDIEDIQLASLIPSGRDMLALRNLMKDLQEFESTTKLLQNSDCNLSEVRGIFDAICLIYPDMEFYLDKNAQIVHTPDFENGIVKLIDGNDSGLEMEEEEILELFLNVDYMESQLKENEQMEQSIAQKALNLKRQRTVVSCSSYYDLRFIPPTSNVVERLFSNARLVLTDYRKSMTPYSFECVMFLKCNRKQWNISTVMKLVAE